jgi:hypothetical protein
MKRVSFLAVMGVAAATVAVILVLLSTRMGDANSEGPRVTPTISQPEMTVDGCRFTVALDQTAYASGEQPELHVTASNPTDRNVEAALTLQIQSSSPASPMSRVVQLPTPLWTDRWVVNLRPGESRVKRFDTEVGLPEGHSVTVTLNAGDQVLLAGRIRAAQQLAPRIVKSSASRQR